MINENDLQQIASLASLAITEEEKVRLKQDLNEIFDYAKQLNSIDTDQIEPLTHAIPHKMKLREDLIDQFVLRQELLNQAPALENNFFSVPKI